MHDIANIVFLTLGCLWIKAILVNSICDQIQTRSDSIMVEGLQQA